MAGIVRYSPHPIGSYSPVDEGVVTGPAASAFLRQDAEAWNLAFLSHPYEDEGDPSDPHFTVNIRRTLQYILTSGSIDLANVMDSRRCLRHWLQYPAPQAVKLILDLGGRLVKLPMYRAYGPSWVETIQRRSWACIPAEDEGDVLDLGDANSLLAKFRVKL